MKTLCYHCKHGIRESQLCYLSKWKDCEGEKFEPRPPEGTVFIGKEEYEALVKDSVFLDSLYTAGVDSWEGYSYAQRLFRGQDV